MATLLTLLRAKHALDRPLTEAQRHKNEALHAELIQLRSDQVKATTELQELKEERVRLMEQNVSGPTGRLHPSLATRDHLLICVQAARSGDITHATNSIGQARSRLVQSPDRIKKEISEMSHSVAQERISLAQFQQKSRELNKRLEVIKSLEVDLRALIDVEKGVDEMRTALEKRKRSKTGLEGDLQGAEIETDSLESKIQVGPDSAYL
jgi:kinetochore protein Nuf2